jgi:pantetheine-phosphate adenylyltransferase
LRKRFDTVVVGGTFDEFHKGHRALLMKAFEVGNRVLIGLCTDDFAEKLRKPHNFAAYEERLRELKQFLRRLNVLDRGEVLPLGDPYGVTLSTNCPLDAIVVSRETEPRAKEINTIRTTKGLPPLEVIVVEMIPAENRVDLSTTRIRQKVIDREGLGKSSSKHFAF